MGHCGDPRWDDFDSYYEDCYGMDPLEVEEEEDGEPSYTYTYLSSLSNTPMSLSSRMFLWWRHASDSDRGDPAPDRPPDPPTISRIVREDSAVDPPKTPSVLSSPD